MSGLPLDRRLSPCNKFPRSFLQGDESRGSRRLDFGAMTITATLLQNNGPQPESSLHRLKLNGISRPNGKVEGVKRDEPKSQPVLVDPFNYVVSITWPFFRWSRA